jgi:hypothetical protein
LTKITSRSVNVSEQAPTVVDAQGETRGTGPITALFETAATV